MPFVISGEKLILFAHVPKAGGTSFEDYLRRRFGHLGMRDHRWANRDLNARSLVTSPQHVIGEDLARLFPPEMVALSLALVREPTARAVSAYRYQAHNHNIPGRWRKGFARLGFSVWLAMAVEATRRAPWVFDGHLRPQVDFLPPDCETFRLEEGLGPAVARLDAVAPPSEVSADGPRRVESKARFSARPSRRDLALIRRVYAEDFRRLGYPEPDLEAAPRDRLGWARHALGRALAPLAVRLYRSGRM